MKFTLYYDGPLPPKGSPQDKHRVRQAIHRQLAERWELQPLSLLPEDARADVRREVGGHQFLSIVNDEFRLRAELDVLILRPQAPGSIWEPQGDIDNQLKTLFDALQIPKQPQELPPGWGPTDDEVPMYCLLDDDRFVTSVRVETERLLAASSPDQVRVSVRVRTWALAGDGGIFELHVGD